MSELIAALIDGFSRITDRTSYSQFLDATRIAMERAPNASDEPRAIALAVWFVTARRGVTLH